jgi:hypothetical protein
MRHLVAALAAACLFACAPAPAPAPVPTPTPAATVGPPPIAPGATQLQERWVWDPQGPISTELAAVLADFKSPDDVAAYLAGRLAWADDYDTSHFLSPDELVKQGRGVCSAFARFWAVALERQGYRVDVLAFWGPASAHAVAVWRDEGGHFRMASNQDWSPRTDLGTERDPALVRAAVEFYGASWSNLLVYDPSGQLRQRIPNQVAPVPAAIASPGRNLFTIRR